MALLIIGIILFIGLVVAHEFGHFIMARRNGVEVEEFGIFFPPRLWTRKTKGGWLFSINWLPLGGFVKLKGEHDTDTEPGSFGAASVWAKSQIMAAGVVMNLIVAFILLMVIAWLGMPQLVKDQFTVSSDTRIVKNEVLAAYVEPGSPADKAGVKSRDRLVSLSASGYTRQLDSADSLPEVTKKYAGQSVVLTYERAGLEKHATVQLLGQREVEESRKTDNPKGYLGVMPTSYTLQRSTWSAPIVAAGLMKQFTVLTFQGLGTALSALVHGDTAKASEQVSGPVGIFVILQQGSLLGYQFMLLIIAVISLTLAIMNILPIPALDGGRLWITLVARGLKKPLSPAKEELINAGGFLFLIGLIILITVVDVRRFF